MQAKKPYFRMEFVIFCAEFMPIYVTSQLVHFPLH